MENCNCHSVKWRGLTEGNVTGNFNHHWPDRSENDTFCFPEAHSFFSNLRMPCVFLLVQTTITF